jgi:hypothetical protein
MNRNEDQDKALRTAKHALMVASSAQTTLAEVSSAANTNSTVNSGAIVAAASIIAPAVADLPTQAAGPKAFLVSGVVFARHSAVDTAVTFQLIEDPAGAATPFGPIVTADSSHVSANATATIPPTKRVVPALAVRKYAVRVATAAGTVSVLAINEAEVTVQPLA